MRAQLDGVEEYLKKTGRYDLSTMQRLSELRVTAEQKLGGLLARMKKAKGSGSNQHKKKDRSTGRTDPPKTLAEMGIKKNTSSLAQKINARPADKVEEVFQEASGRWRWRCCHRSRRNLNANRTP